MKEEKNCYETPNVEVVELKSEGVICSSAGDEDVPG